MSAILPSAARTTSGTFVLPSSFGNVAAACFGLIVSAAATDAGDTLDVYVQHSPDGGTTWDDFIHFTQVLGNGGAKAFIAQWNALASPESELHVPSDAAMAAGVLQGPVGNTVRIKWVIVNAGAANQSFTFSVSLDAVRRAL